jgi:flagellar biosynthesis protein FlhF
MTTALKMVKDELGQDAVILSARSLKNGSGIFASRKTIGVEVTAAIDANIPPSGRTRSTRNPAASGSREPHTLPGQQSSSRRQFLPPFQKQMKNQGYRGSADHKPKTELGPQGGALSVLFQHLLAQEVARDHAVRLIDEIQKTPGADDWADSENLRHHFADVMREMGVKIDPFQVGGSRPKTVVLVGPPGVGKTTTIAKIAASCFVEKNMRVALITLDDYRIAAAAQLKVYAEIIGVPLEVIRTEADLKKSIKKYRRYDCLLVDSPGIGRMDRNRLDELRGYLNMLKSKQVHLLLSGCTKEKALVAQVERFECLPVDALGFTKIDESATFGNLLNLLVRSKPPLSMMATGQQVPEDFRQADMELLSSLVLPAETSAALTGEGRSQASGNRCLPVDKPLPFAANRSSDVYHRMACKWTRKIKPEHRLEFNSIEEAEARGFLPCGNCNPNRVNRPEEELQRDQLKISGYL